MYKHSPVRSQRSKGIKIKHVVQVCLLIVVSFWLIFQVKRSYDKKKDFDANNHKITHSDDEIVVKLGRKDLQPKLEETTQEQKNTQEQEDEEEQEENKHEEDEDKIEDDESDQERSNMEIDRDEVLDIIDEDKESENDGQSETDEDGSTEHTHEAREEHYKADDASSAVITTHDPENQIRNKTLDDNSSENDETTKENGQEKDSESVDSHSPPNTTITSTANQFDSNSRITEILKKNEEMLTGEENSYDQLKSEYLETNTEDPIHLQEKEVRNDLETLPGIEAEGDDATSAE